MKSSYCLCKTFFEFLELSFQPVGETVAELGKLANARYVLLSNLFILEEDLTLYARIADVERGITVTTARSSVRMAK